MISIIICSRNSQIEESLNSNIKETINSEYELIVVDNSMNNYSIFEAYNLGIQKSKGEYLCFIHDDIIVNTKNWGGIIERIFSNDSQVGLIGVAGGKIKMKMPSAWWDGGKVVLKLVQHYKNKPQELWDQGFEKTDIVEVSAIDGVFMVMKNDGKIQFDESLIGFHCYDLYLSLKHHILGKKVIVTNKILIEHFSEGNLDKSWFESTSIFHKKYKKYLPIISESGIDFYKLRNQEVNLCADFISKLIEYKLYKDAIYWWFEFFKLKPVAKFHYRFWYRMIKIMRC
ncbi:hypothetical protein B6A10_15405 [Flavobacterium sp. L1I52]|uniref:Streptomycin biosynthesis protein StrF domain-containing protein n=1 Tax=Flavobacterium pokkalii TaxID=1940408 RepID=A0ABR7UY76_9FLAO|nr:glycosyltransferase [Flavobacterium pokkalii]MBD0726559.1 hypothetical protein [Flavobacterium pokkalii]